MHETVLRSRAPFWWLRIRLKLAGRIFVCSRDVSSKLPPAPTVTGSLQTFNRHLVTPIDDNKRHINIINRTKPGFAKTKKALVLKKAFHSFMLGSNPHKTSAYPDSFFPMRTHIYCTVHLKKKLHTVVDRYKKLKKACEISKIKSN